MEWIKIDRDKDGFATESAINRMFAHFPIVIATEFNEHGIDLFYDVVTHENFVDYMGDIQTKTRITNYLPIPKLEV